MVGSLFARTSPSAVAGLVFSDGASEFLKDEPTAEQWNAWMQVIETTTPPGREAPDYESSVTELRAVPSPPRAPTIVLTADTPWNLPLGGSGATWPAWLLAQDRLATLLQARHITDTASGHGIAVENPRCRRQRHSGHRPHRAPPRQHATDDVDAQMNVCHRSAESTRSGSIAFHRMRRAAAVLTALLIMATVPACSGGDDEPSATGATANGSPEAATPTTGVIASSDPRAQQITDVVTEALPELRLQSVVFGVWDGDRLIVKGAMDAPSVQPRTAVDARVRVGQPMEAMLGTVLLQLAAEGKVDLDEPVEEYVPDLVNADRITPRMLANSTGGTPDYVTEPDFLARVSVRSVHRLHLRRAAGLRPEEPAALRAGSSFAYSHTEMAALVQVLEQASGQSLEDLMAARIFRPLKMKASAAHQDNAIEEPVFHALHQPARRVRGLDVLGPDLGIPRRDERVGRRSREVASR